MLMSSLLALLLLLVDPFFGYDIGISGGVTFMDAFLKKFFSKVYEKKKHSHENNHCKFNDQGLAAFISSLYLAGLVATLFASPVTRNYGCRISIVCDGLSFLVGAALNTAAVDFAMLLSGQVMLGVGIGFGNQMEGNTIPVVDKLGRRVLLIGGGILMIICQQRHYSNLKDANLLRFLVDMRGVDIDDIRLRDDLMTMLIAGHEITAAVLTGCTPSCSNIERNVCGQSNIPTK